MSLRTVMMRITGSLKSIYYLMVTESDQFEPLSPGLRLKYLFRGFNSRSYHMFDLKNNDYHDYLPDYYRYKISIINKPYQTLLNDKYVFGKVTAGHDWAPILYGYIKNGKTIIGEREVTSSELENLLMNVGKLMIKVSDLGGGKGIHLLEYVDGRILFDHEPNDLDSSLKTLDKDRSFIISEFIGQGRYASRIYAGSTNTIRVVTMKDKMTDEVYIPVAIHKFGTERSGHTDNISKGGIAAPIDIKTGEIISARAYIDEDMVAISEHPDTKEKLVGTIIPNWLEVMESVKEMARSLDHIYYVGWDIAIQETGIKVIEGNNNPNLDFQSIYPYLKDKRIVHFLKQHDVIR